MTQPPSSSSLQPIFRTKFKKERAFEPIYTGGASTAISPNGKYLFAPVNETIHITQVTSGKTINQIPSDFEDVTCLTLTHDGNTLLVASRSLAVRVIQIDYTNNIEENNTSEKEVSWKIVRSIAKTHDAPVVIMQIDPTDTLLATGSSDGCAKVWDIRGGFCTHVFRNHGGIVSSLEWNMPLPKSAESNESSDRVVELFTGSIDGKVRLWDLKASTPNGPQYPAAVLESHFSVVRGLSVNHDGSRLVSAGRDRVLTFWEKQNTSNGAKGRGKQSAANSHWRMVDSVTTSESLESSGFLPNSLDSFYTAGAEGEIRIWNFEKRMITSVQPDGRFARGKVSKRKAVQSVDEEVEEKDEDETRAITEIHCLSQLNLLVSVHANQNVVFRSASDLVMKRRLVGFNDQIIDMALLSSKTKADTHLAVATNTNAISVYSLESEEHSVELLPSEADSEYGHTNLVLCLDKSSDGKWLASGAKDRSVRIWAQISKWKAPPLLDDDGKGEKVSVKEANIQGKTTVQDLQWHCVAIAEGHTESVGAVAFARRPATPEAIGAPFLVSGSQDRTAKVWDLSKLSAHIDSYHGEPLQLSSLTTLKIHDKDINALDISPNNALLLSGSQDKTAKVFSINYVAPSKANGHSAIASLKLVNVCRGHKRGVWSVAFSPSDAVFLTGSGDRSMKLWSINQDFSCIKNYIGHTNSVLKVRFLKGSNGLQCMSCASDGLVKVWNVKTEECIDTLDGHEDRVWGLECSQKGDVIISGAADSLVCFWKDVTAEIEVERVIERQQEVEKEQQFSNLLAVKDYRNAISLALAMNQPRRLFNLFSAIDSARSQGDSTTSTGKLLDSALQSKEGRNIDPSLQALVRAGVLSSTSAGFVEKNDTNNTDTSSGVSITGSSSVDQVIKTLPPSDLRSLLRFIRDWNTSSRTSHIAQTVLHAILRFHSADEIIAAYEKKESQLTNGTNVEKQNERRESHRRESADLKEIIEAIIPYTKRHYDRAQRLLTESAMLQYTLACMDSVLGADVDEEQPPVNGIASNGDVIMNGKHHEEGDEDTSSGSDEVMSDVSM